MSTVLDRKRADATITMRVSSSTRDLIDHAAQLVDKSRSEFMIDSARNAAINVMLDQTVFHLNAAESEALAVTLDNPPAPVETLRALLRSKSAWQ